MKAGAVLGVAVGDTGGAAGAADQLEGAWEIDVPSAAGLGGNTPVAVVTGSTFGEPMAEKLTREGSGVVGDAGDSWAGPELGGAGGAGSVGCLLYTSPSPRD